MIGQSLHLEEKYIRKVSVTSFSRITENEVKF